jgi:hypothetical protein
MDKVRLCFCFIKVGSIFITFFLEEVQYLRVALTNRTKSVGYSSIFCLRLETDAVVKIPEYELSRSLLLYMIGVFNILDSCVTNLDCISVLMLKSVLLTICFALFTGIVF